LSKKKGNNKLPAASIDYILEEIGDLDYFLPMDNLAIIFDFNYEQAHDNYFYSDEILNR
jgi:hypothetical protein